MYTGYRGVANTTVAKFSPSGYYIACGSTGGWLNIVASKRNDAGDFIEKAKYEVLSGPVKDIAWSMDNQRCLVVGDGKDSFTRAFIVDLLYSGGLLRSRTVSQGRRGRCRAFRLLSGVLHVVTFSSIYLISKVRNCSF